MAPKRQLPAGGRNFSRTDIQFLDGEDDIYRHCHGSSSSDTQYSLEYDSDGFSDGSKDSKEATWTLSRRKSRPTRKRRRVSSTINQPLFADTPASPPAPLNQQQQQPTNATVLQPEALQDDNEALKRRVAALEADYTALHVYVEHMAQELKNLQQTRGRNSSPPDGPCRPSGQSFR